MLSTEQFRDRASIIYSGQRDRHKKRLMKAAPKGVEIVLRGDEILPYTRQEFYSWLWKRVGLQAIPCPYCNSPIDILSLLIDHMIPLKLGGSVGLDNQEPICAGCNGAKGALMPEQFRALLQFLRTLGPTAEADILGRMKMGGGFMRSRFINNSKKPANAQRKLKPKQDRLVLDEF
jgi:hypothetical protein